MNFKKFIIAAIAAFIVLFILDYLWFGMIFKNFLVDHGFKIDSENVTMQAFADLCLAILLALIFPIGYKGGAAINEGIKFGVLTGLVYMLPSAIHMHAMKMKIGDALSATPLWTIHNVVFMVLNGIIVCAIAGIVVAMIYGKKESPAAT